MRGQKENNVLIPSNQELPCPFCGSQRTMMVLHCEWCDKPYDKFLAQQLAETEEAASRAVRNAVKNLTREVEKMAPNFGTNEKPDKRDSRASGDSSSYSDFIKGSDLPKNGTVNCKVLGLREDRLEYSMYQLDFTIGKKQWTLGLRDEQDGRLRMLVRVLGGNSDRWKGKTFKMQRHSKTDRSGNPRIQIL